MTISTNTRVLVGGQAVATLNDTYTIVNCPFTAAPTPCTTVQWFMPAARVQVQGQPVVLQTSPGMCLNATQVPMGPAAVLAVQSRVWGM